MSENTTDQESAHVLFDYENVLKELGIRTEILMDVLELTTAMIMIVLFAIGVYDLGLKVYLMLNDGSYTDPNVVIKVIDTALLLLIIVEIYRTVIAYVEDKRILPIVLNVAVIAMARKVISFRTGKYATTSDALLSAAAYGLLLIVVIVAFYMIHRIQQRTDFDIYAADGGPE